MSTSTRLMLALVSLFAIVFSFLGVFVLSAGSLPLMGCFAALEILGFVTLFGAAGFYDI